MWNPAAPSKNPAKADATEREDLLPTRRFRLKDALPHVCAKPVRTLEFGFHPEAWWPNAERQALDDGGSPLFTRGVAVDVEEPIRFPDLAQT
jgi:hypothetical protein